MTDPMIEIAQQMEQWARDFSTDEDHDVFLGWAQAVRRLAQEREALVSSLRKFLAHDETMEGILWDSEPDTATIKITIPLGQYRNARKALKTLVA